MTSHAPLLEKKGLLTQQYVIEHDAPRHQNSRASYEAAGKNHGRHYHSIIFPGMARQPRLLRELTTTVFPFFELSPRCIWDQDDVRSEEEETGVRKGGWVGHGQGPEVNYYERGRSEVDNPALYVLLHCRSRVSVSRLSWM